MERKESAGEEVEKSQQEKTVKGRAEQLCKIVNLMPTQQPAERDVVM